MGRDQADVRLNTAGLSGYALLLDLSWCLESLDVRRFLELKQGVTHARLEGTVAALEECAGAVIGKGRELIEIFSAYSRMYPVIRAGPGLGDKRHGEGGLSGVEGMRLGLLGWAVLLQDARVLGGDATTGASVEGKKAEKAFAAASRPVVGWAQITAQGKVMSLA